jgi:uncharacterized protein YdgA (DUF945 family)
MKVEISEKKTGTTTKIVATIVILLTVLIGSSYWVGSRVEQKFRENVPLISTLMSKQGITISVVDYQRSVFGATARTDVVFRIPSSENPSATELITVPVFHSVQHGPLPALTAAAHIHSKAQPVEGGGAQLDDELFELFPELDTVISWSGGLDLHLVSPELEVTIKNITVKSDAPPAEEDKNDYTGKTSAALDKLYFQRKGDSGAVRSAEFENVRAMVAASIKDGVLDTGEVKFDADRIIMERETKEKIDNISLAFLFENIDTQVIDDPWQAIVDLLDEQKQNAAPWLQRKPAFTIKDMRARWPEGMATGSFRIAYVGDANSGTPFGNISGDLQMLLPRALAIRHMSSQVSEEITDALEGGEENEVNVEKETKEQVDKQMAAMLKDGIFVEKGDTLSVDAHLRNGELDLNGKTQPIELLLELIPPFM